MTAVKGLLPLALAGGIAVAARTDTAAPTQPSKAKAPELLQQQPQPPHMPVSPLVIVTVSGSIPAAGPQGNGQTTLRVDCPSGDKILRGGYAITGEGAGFAYAFQSYPSSDASWTVSANSTFGGGAVNLTSTLSA